MFPFFPHLLFILAAWSADGARQPSSRRLTSIELIDWKLTLPVSRAPSTKPLEIKETELTWGFEFYPWFVRNRDGSLTFRADVNGATTRSSRYTRCELREMLRRGKNIGTVGLTKNNWLPSAHLNPASTEAVGGLDGWLHADLRVDHVTTTGSGSKVGRVIIGQIHGRKDEPVRLYYHKQPHHQRGSLYIAHEPINGPETWHILVGSRSGSTPDPVDGVRLGERFRYQIAVEGDRILVKVWLPSGKTKSVEIDLNGSGYLKSDREFFYFKAGVYNQYHSEDVEPGDYVQATFFSLTNHHTGYKY